LPNYWLLLTVNIWLSYTLKLPTVEYSALRYYFFLQNLWYPYLHNFFTEGWSLSIEEWFYLTLPIVMYVSNLIFSPTNKQRFLLRVFLGYMMVFIVVRFYNAFDPLNGLDPDEGIRKVVVFRLDAVMYGVVFAWFNFYKKETLDRMKNYLFGISAVGTVLLYCITTRWDLMFFTHLAPVPAFYRNAFLFLFVPLLLSFCLPYANNIRRFGSESFSRAVQFISKISYSMYLVHYSLVFLAFYRDARVSSHWAVAGLYILYWVIVIGLSALIYKYFEYPVMQLREKLSMKK